MAAWPRDASSGATKAHVSDAERHLLLPRSVLAGEFAILESVIRAVVFDLDGVLLDSEKVWDEARRAVSADNGGSWHEGATTAMQGMSSREWSAYLRDALGVDLATDRIVNLVVDAVLSRYRRKLPIVPSADEVLDRIASRWPLALASSANREVIDSVLDLAGWKDRFQATVSSEEVPRGKPWPDVYLEAARRLAEAPGDCVAIEDSANGIRSALAAGLSVVAVPSRDFAPPDGLLRRVAAVIGSLRELTVEFVEAVSRQIDEHREERLDEAEVESFPASDPHADWAGPAS
ncbi:MAG: HAD family phosphatase [Acidimicrobiales bacterium]